MLKRILQYRLWFILIFTLVVNLSMAQGIFLIPTQAAKENKLPGNYTFIFYLPQLETSAIKEHTLPNLDKLQKLSVSYENVAPIIPRSGQNALTAILGEHNEQLSLIKNLTDNQIKCIAVDATESLPISLTKASGMQLISEPKDKLAIDELLSKMKGDKDFLYQFILICLDDASFDNQVGRVVNQMIRTDLLANSTIVITGGTNSPPLIINHFGQNQAESFTHCSQSDIAPTLCALFEIDSPESMSGEVLYESLPEENYKAYSTKLKHRLNNLRHEKLEYSQQLTLLQAGQQSMIDQKDILSLQQAQIDQIIAKKDSVIHKLNRQLKLYKYLIIFVLFISFIGYIFQNRLLRKKFLIF